MLTAILEYKREMKWMLESTKLIALNSYRHIKPALDNLQIAPEG